MFIVSDLGVPEKSDFEKLQQNLDFKNWISKTGFQKLDRTLISFNERLQELE